MEVSPYLISTGSSEAMISKTKEEGVMFLDNIGDGKDISRFMKERSKNSTNNDHFTVNCILRSSSRDFSVNGNRKSSLL